MNLEKSHNRVARWDVDKWFVGDVACYRWRSPMPEDLPASEWFTTIRDALDWLMENHCD